MDEEYRTLGVAEVVGQKQEILMDWRQFSNFGQTVPGEELLVDRCRLYSTSPQKGSVV